MSKKALIVDDSATMHKMVTISLQELCFETTIAGDGLEASKQAQQTQFDVITTDVSMPNMDGIELIKVVRKLLS
jgi:CheY-like chemotaxis protein